MNEIDIIPWFRFTSTRQLTYSHMEMASFVI